MTHPVDISIVIPAYNERERIGPTVSSYDDWLARAGARYEIIVVDDGSSDHTAELVRSIGARRPRVRAIACRPNRGKGAAVRVGMLAARGRVRVMTDADGSVAADQLPTVVEPVWTGRAAIAIGSRYVAGARVAQRQPWYRVMWSRLGNALVQRALIPGVLDTQCGFKAFSAEAATRLFSLARVDGWAFDLEVLALAHRWGLAIDERPVAWADDPRSKIDPVRDAFKNIAEMWAIRRNLRAGVYDRGAPALRGCAES